MVDCGHLSARDGQFDAGRRIELGAVLLTAMRRLCDCDILTFSPCTYVCIVEGMNGPMSICPHNDGAWSEADPTQAQSDICLANEMFASR